MSTEVTPWPRFCATSEETLNWLNKQRPADNAGKKAVLTLRWLLHQALEERKPFDESEINPATAAAVAPSSN